MVEEKVANKFQAQRIHCFCSQERCTDAFFFSTFLEILEIDDVQDRLEFFEHSLLFAHSSLPECTDKMRNLTSSEFDMFIVMEDAFTRLNSLYFCWMRKFDWPPHDRIPPNIPRRDRGVTGEPGLRSIPGG